MNTDKAVEINRSHWDAVSSLHLDAEQYHVEAVKAGESSLSALEISKLGPVEKLKGAHLQCGIGLDTISVARMGAEMTGFDISSIAIMEARKLSKVCGQEIQFIETDIYRISSNFDDSFDFVYTSHGVLRWLPNLGQWATTIERILKSGGFLFIFEIHPLVYRLKATENDNAVLTGNYFSESLRTRAIYKNHADAAPPAGAQLVAQTDWTMSTILNSLLACELSITEYDEYQGCSYSRREMFPEQHDNLYYPTGKFFPFPLAFSIRAVKGRQI